MANITKHQKGEAVVRRAKSGLWDKPVRIVRVITDVDLAMNTVGSGDLADDNPPVHIA